MKITNMLTGYHQNTTEVSLSIFLSEIVLMKIIFSSQILHHVVASTVQRVVQVIYTPAWKMTTLFFQIFTRRRS